MNEENTIKNGNDQQKAQVLAHYFETVVARERDEEIKSTEKANVPVLKDMTFTDTLMLKIMKKLKSYKSPGLDEIHE